jgi:beta-mannanase
MVTWEPWRPGDGAYQAEYSLERIVSGAFDAYISQWARDLHALRSTIYLRPMHEMNGDWYPWGGTVNGNSPELFRQAWAHMHRIFEEQGAHNVKWVFSPVNEDWPRNPGNRFEQYYPGAGLVDVLALDGYNWGSTKPNFGGWRTFRTTFASAYKRLSRLGPQPVWITEVGSATEGGNKAAWVRGMFRTAPKMRRLNTIIWMDTIDEHEGDWRVRSPINVPAAFRAASWNAPRQRR